MLCKCLLFDSLIIINIIKIITKKIYLIFFNNFIYQLYWCVEMS